MPKPRIAILNQGLLSQALVLATGLPLLQTDMVMDYVLCYQDAHAKTLPPTQIDELSTQMFLQLQPVNGDKAVIHVDFLQGKLGFRRQPGRFDHEPLARAVGVTKQQRPSIIDATAGWGTDSFLLANVGCEVSCIEADPLIACLLNDGLRRLHAKESISINLQIGQALNLLPSLVKDNYPEVIYLDPMFPTRSKSAAVKKNMAFLHTWLAEPKDNEQADLLAMALNLAKKRVVVKRPLTAPALGERKPSGYIRTKQHRFDIYGI